MSSLSLSHLGGITFTFSSRWAQRLPGLSDGPHDWVYTDTQVMRRSRQRVFLRERERAREGSRREWVSPHLFLLRNLTGGCWPSTISVQSTRRQFSRFPIQRSLSYTNQLFQGFKTKKELTALFSSYEVRRLGKSWNLIKNVGNSSCQVWGSWLDNNKYKYKYKYKVQVQIQIQIPAARSEEDGGTDQRPSWLPEQNS